MNPNTSTYEILSWDGGRRTGTKVDRQTYNQLRVSQAYMRTIIITEKN